MSTDLSRRVEWDCRRTADLPQRLIWAVAHRVRGVLVDPQDVARAAAAVTGSTVQVLAWLGTADPDAVAAALAAGAVEVELDATALAGGDLLAAVAAVGLAVHLAEPTPGMLKVVLPGPGQSITAVMDTARAAADAGADLVHLTWPEEVDLDVVAAVAEALAGAAGVKASAGHWTASGAEAAIAAGAVRLGTRDAAALLDPR